MVGTLRRTTAHDAHLRPARRDSRRHDTTRAAAMANSTAPAALRDVVAWPDGGRYRSRTCRAASSGCTGSQASSVLPCTSRISAYTNQRPAPRPPTSPASRHEPLSEVARSGPCRVLPARRATVATGATSWHAASTRRLNSARSPILLTRISPCCTTAPWPGSCAQAGGGTAARTVLAADPATIKVVALDGARRLGAGRSPWTAATSTPIAAANGIATSS